MIIIKTIPAVMMFCAAVCFQGNAAQGEDVSGNFVSRAEGRTNGAPVAVSNHLGNVRLTFTGAGLSLWASGDLLAGLPPEYRFPTRSKGSTPVPLWLNGAAVAPMAPHEFTLLDQRSSNEWSYASLDLTPAFRSNLQQFHRALLQIDPDLTVVFDEIILTEPATIQTGGWFPGEPSFDDQRNEWHLQQPNAGLTLRALSSPRNSFRLWEPSASEPGPGCLRLGSTNAVSEYRQITVLITHEKAARRSLAFKLLESDTAIGARVHRDGLPTLIAFRKNSVSGQADLTGLKFTGPVAVDVFRPKRK